MRILFLTHSFNSLAQRLFVELRQLGHEVSVEFDINDAISEEAVDLFGAGQFDVILMDMNMPDMDGLSATRAIRAIERNIERTPTPIIMLTANDDEDQRAASLEAGADLHLAKPITPQALLAAISSLRASDDQDDDVFTIAAT